MKQPLLAGAVLLLSLSSAFAQSVQGEEKPQPLPDSALVAERGGAVLTLGDMRAKLRTALPTEKRRGFFTDGARVAPLIDDLLATRQIAAVARENGLDKDAQLRAEVEAYELDLLARSQIAAHMAALEEPDYAILARERYLTNKEGYALPEVRDVRHILIRVPAEGRSEQDAKAIADKVQGLLEAGGDFDEVFEEYAEDSREELKGWVRDIRYEDELDPAFADMAFSLETLGEVSKPVLSTFGYHVIRLEAVTPSRTRSYDEVKDEIIGEIRREYRMAARAAYVGSFTSQALKLNDETMKQLPTQE